MKSLLALMRKEYMEATRTGKIMIIILLFVLFGIMSPAVAKLTPWMMKMLSDSMAESGLIVTNVQVDALTSWTQFFKNIPIALIAFVLIFSDIFTKEYKSGTLLLVLTKGLSRYKLCHINVKRRLGWHIFLPNKVLQKIFCLCHNPTEQIRQPTFTLDGLACFFVYLGLLDF